MWSLGCVLAELVILRPVLEGEDTGDQLASIVDILGVPSDEDLENMRVEDNICEPYSFVKRTLPRSEKDTVAHVAPVRCV